LKENDGLKQDGTLQTAVRAGLTLTCFSDREPELSVSRLASLLDIPASNAYRLLASLEAAGLLEQNPDTKRYRLSWLMFSLGNIVLNQMGIGGRTDAAMRALVDICGETVSLGIRSGGSVIYIRRIESLEMLRADTAVGSRVPLHCTAIGKLLLAYLPEEELRQAIESAPLKRFTDNTITDLVELRKELSVIRKNSISIDNQEFGIGVRGMACPILDRHCRVVASLSIGAPASRLSYDRMRELEQVLRTQANVISRSLDCQEQDLIPVIQTVRNSK